MSYSSLQELIEQSEQQSVPVWRIVMENDMCARRISEEEAFSDMRGMYQAMKAADESYSPELRSASGMVGGDGEKLARFRQRHNRLIGDYLTEVMEKAVKMAESNACMKRIVAAPTAGSCGVIPAVLLVYEKLRGIPEDKMVEALFVAGGIGEVIAANASIAGAEGGCQAEIGTASAMAGGAISYLEGGDGEEIIHAAALALKNMLGLTCDPVAGLVEIPCVKRNVYGAVNAVVSSQMARAGIRSVIPPDEVVDAMRRTGKMLPACLRETSQEGLAITPAAKRIEQQLKTQV